MKRTFVALLGIVVLPALAAGDGRRIEQPPDHPYATLEDGPGAQLTRNSCGICHSIDYIVTQPRGDAKQWDGVVTKMMKVYGAPISEADAKAIVEYLATAYGPRR